MESARLLEMPRDDDDKNRMRLVAVACETGVLLRRTSADLGARQTSDFLNGMIFAGVLAQRNMPVQPGHNATFPETFRAETERRHGTLTTPAAIKAVKDLTAYVGVAGAHPSVDQMISLGLYAEAFLKDMAKEFDFDREDVLVVVSIILLLGIASVSSSELMDENILICAKALNEKAEEFERIIPSDEELFGEEFLDKE